MHINAIKHIERQREGKNETKNDAILILNFIRVYIYIKLVIFVDKERRAIINKLNNITHTSCD